MKTVLNWSSGKDAALAFYRLSLANEYEVTHLLTTVNDEHRRVVMHGVKEELLDAQAAAIGLPAVKVYLPPSPKDDLYKKEMELVLNRLKYEGITASAFGDIFLEDLKTYREQQLATVGVKAVFPLWKMDTVNLVKEVEDAGIEAVIVVLMRSFWEKNFWVERLTVSSWRIYRQELTLVAKMVNSIRLFPMPRFSGNLSILLQEKWCINNTCLQMMIRTNGIQDFTFLICTKNKSCFM
jgi:uncharacterized protein (TIGR00290 family)